MLPNAVEPNPAARLPLDNPVSAHVIAVRVGVDDKLYPGRVHTKFADFALCVLKVGQIARINEDGFLGPIHKVVSV
jgi:hypothetical protein